MEDALGISLGVGALIACALSAYSWETRPRLRLLPVLYCAFAGVVVAICIWDQNNLAAVMAAADRAMYKDKDLRDPPKGKLIIQKR